ncbi:MAG: alpha-D-ribose 1-methylphosphonate 5-triphosphate diphosphatase [Alphaproteobacteria bacterium]
MTEDTILANADLVTPEGVRRGYVAISGGRIAEIGEGDRVPAGALDLEGDYLAPGLVELHTDNVEKHMVPRPGVFWPAPVAAILSHDAQMAAAGVTTVYDAIAVGEYSDRSYRRALLKTVLEAIGEAREKKLFRADHRVHLRCEISDDAVIDLFEPYADDEIIGMISLMDHTPGQRQWRDLKSYKTFRGGGMTDAEFDAFIAERIASSSKRSAENRQTVLKLWGGRGPVASHDDTIAEHVAEAVADGIRISEFPTTMAAAEAAKAAGMTTVMGAPNVVRGGSHSGNVSALELAEAGLLDALSSDYAPISLVHGAFALHDRAGLPLEQAVAMVSANPAAMLGLDDRGAIEAGKRADVIRVRRVGDAAIVRGTWVEGDKAA